MSDQAYPVAVESDDGVGTGWRRRLWIVDLLVVAVFVGWGLIRMSAGLEATDVAPRLLLLFWFGVTRPVIRAPNAAAAPPTSTPSLRVWAVVVGGSLAVTTAQILYLQMALNGAPSGTWPVVEGALFIGALLSWFAVWIARGFIGRKPLRRLSLSLFGLYLFFATATTVTVVAASPTGRDLARAQFAESVADSRVIFRFVLGQSEGAASREVLPGGMD